VRTVVHLSDLHFGCVDPRRVDGVMRAVERLQPDLVAVSGDLTQRARRWQFREARRFLDAIPAPKVIVPGNHDVPLYNVVARLAFPLRGFRDHITEDLCPWHVDDEIVVAGANTTRSLTIKDGGFREPDVQFLAARLRSADPRLMKIVVCHHPFDRPRGRVGRFTTPAPAIDAMPRLLEAGADIFLTGHLHKGYAGGTAHRYRASGLGAIVVEAGTATSTRTRGEPNSFNTLRLERDAVSVERHEWDADGREFVRADTQIFSRGDKGWTMTSNGPTAKWPNDQMAK
jgi:3',5'-cyclic AMP phosphodiesterase CpdA